jgi:tRNA (mo5U34)-methyltransferase
MGASPITTQEKIDALGWWHSIELGDGLVSKGLKPLELLGAEANLVYKDDIKGKSVLDIGAWDGAFSFAAEDRGARDVLATDHYCWVGEGWGKKASFDLAKEARGSKIRELVIDVPDITLERVGPFDIVLFLGVFYHLKHPFLALEQIASIPTELLVLETVVTVDSGSEPLMKFFPGRELDNDPSNWWAPNISCVKAMLQVCGFNKIEITPHPNNPQKKPQYGRYYFHASK